MINKLGGWIKKNRLLVLIFGILFMVFFLNAFHESYPDEFDNISGGWLILHGRMPFSGFFTHHGPVAYLLAAFMLIFAGQSFVKFRICYAVLLFIWSVFSFWFLKRRIKNDNFFFFAGYLIVLAFISTHFWGQMFLADNLCALLAIPVYALLFFKIFYREKLETTDIVFISLTTAAIIFISLSYSYLILIIYAAVLYLLLREKGKKIIDKEILKFAAILALPYVLFFFYFIITGSLKDFYYQNFYFNSNYYVYNYEKPVGSGINPLGYAVVITRNFVDQYRAVLTQAKDFNLGYPLTITFALSNLALIIYLLLERKFSLGLFVLSILIFVNTRSSPLTTVDRDYQSAAYILLSIFNGTLILAWLFEILTSTKEFGKKVIFSFLLVLLSIYWIFSWLFIFDKFSIKFFEKYMGKMPLIYDRPNIAPIINGIVGKDEIAWVGPFDFEEIFYLNTKLPSKYQILLPEFYRIEKFKSEMIADFTKNKPKIIIFRTNANIRNNWANSFDGFFMTFLNQYYERLLGTKYYWVENVRKDFDMENHFFFRKEDKKEIIKELMDKGYVKKWD